MKLRPPQFYSVVKKQRLFISIIFPIGRSSLECFCMLCCLLMFSNLSLKLPSSWGLPFRSSCPRGITGQEEREVPARRKARTGASGEHIDRKSVV